MSTMRSKFEGYLPPHAFVMTRKSAKRAAASVSATATTLVTTEDSTAAVPTAAVAFGEGNARSELVFVGGLAADRSSGPNGALLDKMIEAMGRKRAQVYVTPVLSPVDAVRCLEAIRPRVVVALGKAAAQSLAKSPLPAGVLLLETFHPDEMVQNPSAKKACWEQLKVAMKTLGWKK